MLIPIANCLVNPRHIATVEPADWGASAGETRPLKVCLASGQVLKESGEPAAKVMAAILNWASESFSPRNAPPTFNGLPIRHLPDVSQQTIDIPPEPKPRPAPVGNGKQQKRR